MAIVEQDSHNGTVMCRETVIHMSIFVVYVFVCVVVVIALHVSRQLGAHAHTHQGDEHGLKEGSEEGMRRSWKTWVTKV